jgi:hypothetical protein
LREQFFVIVPTHHKSKAVVYFGGLALRKNEEKKFKIFLILRKFLKFFPLFDDSIIYGELPVTSVEPNT